MWPSSFSLVMSFSLYCNKITREPGYFNMITKEIKTLDMEKQIFREHELLLFV